MLKQLRDDQAETVQQLREAVGAGQKRIVVKAPTGFGKTVLASNLVERARERKKRLIYTVPAVSLVDQTVEMFYHQGIYDVGVIQAKHMMTDWSQPVQICSVQTLMKLQTLPRGDLVLIDECHRLFSFYSRWMCDIEWQGVPFIGLSATPWSRGLGKLYNHLIIAATTQDLIDRGLLSDFRVFAPSHPDLTGVRTVAGDYHEGQLSEKMQEGTLTADIVATWMAKGEWRPTLCYAVDRLHAKKLQAQFRAAGVSCAYMDAFTEDEDVRSKETGEMRVGRKTIKKDFHSGATKVVVSVGTLTTGIDWDVRCIILARPTKSEMLFVQIMGRGLRTAPGKADCLILDHSDNHRRLGFVTDIDAAHTTLPKGDLPSPSATDKIRLPKECPQCAYMKPPGTAKCPVCTFVAEAHSTIEPTAGELAEMKRKEIVVDPAKFFAELKCYAQDRHYKPGWAAAKFKDKFGHWPSRDMDPPPAMFVSPKTASWIKSRNIAWVKSKARQSWMENNGSAAGAERE